MAKVRRAIISVSDKKGIVDFAKKLSSMGVEIISTGGTAKSLKDSGVPVKEISDYTGFPEMLDGRVKTLHPKVHGGLLFRRNNPKDLEEIKEYGIQPIDMVVVNLYPFEQTIAKLDVTFDDAIENIDIGGPTMLRSASKNFQSVVVVTDANDYEKVIGEMKTSGGEISFKTRLELAAKVFKLTSRYDNAIADYLTKASGDK